jgi:uracil-DNA glycosylase
VNDYQRLISEVRNCTICSEHLPLGPRPVFHIHPNARIAIIGQAPGTKVHASGVPWDDQSGVRLREWLGVDTELFYHSDLFAILPMGFCYPGKGKTGDLPPRPECAPQWHEALFGMMPNLELSILTGQYAQEYYLGKHRQRNLTLTVRDFVSYLPEFWPLPHPSPLNNRWLKKNEWFEKDVIPQLQKKVHLLSR